MVHDTILGLSGPWVVIFSGRGRELVVVMGVLATGLWQAPGVNRMQVLPRCQPDAGSPE